MSAGTWLAGLLEKYTNTLEGAVTVHEAVTPFCFAYIIAALTFGAPQP